MNVRTEGRYSGKTQGSAVKLRLSKLQNMVFGSYTVEANTSVLMFRRNLMRPSSGWLNAIHAPELNSAVLDGSPGKYPTILNISRTGRVALM